MLRLEVNLCPLETCEQWAEVWADADDFDPDRGCPAPWDRREAWEFIGIDEIDGEKVGGGWEFVCACGETCDIGSVQAKVASYLRD